jgi:tetratricopeptide (TPR) repeat protein
MTFTLTNHASVDTAGQFKFKKLLPGTYTLILTAPMAAQVRRTIEVGPSLADAKHRISITLEFERRPIAGRSNRVSVTQLAIPESARQEYQKGVEHLEKQELDRAVQRFKKALEIAPQFLGPRSRLAGIVYQAKQYDVAEAQYRAILDQNPSSAMALINLGGVLLQQERFEESLAINLRAEKVRADDPLVQAQLGYCYYHLRRIDEAERHLKMAKELEPGHFSFPQLLLADIYHQRQDLRAVNRELAEFLRLHPDSGKAAEVRKLLETLAVPQREKP